MKAHLAANAALVALGIAVAFSDPFYAGIVTLVALFVFLATAVNLLSGAGVLMFATAGLYGVGAYTYAHLTVYYAVSPWLAIALGTALAAVVGVLVVMASLRLQGIYFAVSTLIANLVMSAVFLNARPLTGGPHGIVGVPTPSVSLLGIDLTLRGPWHTVLTLVALFGWLLVVSAMMRGARGVRLQALRMDSVLAGTLGLGTARIRLQVFLLCAGAMGLAGTLYASYATALSPYEFDIFVSFAVLTMVNVGGRLTFVGPIVGAAFLTVPVFLFQPVYALRNLIYGSLLILVITLSPGGLVGIVRRGADRLRPARLQEGAPDARAA